MRAGRSGQAARDGALAAHQVPRASSPSPARQQRFRPAGQCGGRPALCHEGLIHCCLTHGGGVAGGSHQRHRPPTLPALPCRPACLPQGVLRTSKTPSRLRQAYRPATSKPGASSPPDPCPCRPGSGHAQRTSRGASSLSVLQKAGRTTRGGLQTQPDPPER